jgi:hypothetical protein
VREAGFEPWTAAMFNSTPIQPTYICSTHNFSALPNCLPNQSWGVTTDKHPLSFSLYSNLLSVEMEYLLAPNSKLQARRETKEKLGY